MAQRDKHIMRSAATVGGFTLISRVAGYGRDALMAAFLGAGPVADAFFVAFKLPNFFRRLFAEGAFNAAFVPLFSAALIEKGEEEAKRCAQEILTWMVMALLLLVLLVECFMPRVVTFFAPGLLETPERFEVAVQFARITFPYILFISLAALYSGILNSLDKFAAAAGVPILLNVCMISGLLYGITLEGQEETLLGEVLSFSVLLAGVAQLLLLRMTSKRLSFSLGLTVPRLTPTVKRFGKLVLPAALGAGVFQLNLLIDTWFASFLPSGAISYLFYADRLNQLPLGVIGIAISTALLPALSKAVRQQDHQLIQETQNRSIEFSMFLTLPAAVALVLLAEPLSQVLFQRAAFTANDALATAHTLAAFALGLPAYVLVKILTVPFFAQHNTKTPLKIGLVCVGMNFMLNVLFHQSLQHVGIALATALSSWGNVVLLMVLLRKKGMLAVDTRLYHFIPRLILVCITMGAVLLSSQYLCAFNKYVNLLFMISSGLGTFMVGGYVMKLSCVREAQDFIMQRLSR